MTHLLIFLIAVMVSSALTLTLLGMLLRPFLRRTRKPGPPDRVPH